MKRRLYRSLRIVAAGLMIGVVLAIVFAPQKSYAEDFFCPSLFPCDEYNELLSEYENSSDPCAVQFAKVCKDLREKARKDCGGLSSQYNDLQEKLVVQGDKVAKLQKQIRKLRKIKNG